MISSLKNWFETLLTITLAVTPQVIPHTQHGFDYNISFKIGTQQNITSNIETIKPQKSYNLTNTPISINGIGGWWRYPDNIKPAKRDGDDLLVLVNKEYRLPEDYEPKDLVPASNSGIRRGEKFLLRQILIADLANLINNASADGIDLSVVSAYRSYQTQVTTYNYWVTYNKGSTDEADTIAARAGHSQHQLGTAIDFSTSEINDGLSGIFTNTKASKWLSDNAWKYGFVISFPKGFEMVTGYAYESWHYRYIGIENAKQMTERGQILENFLKSKN